MPPPCALHVCRLRDTVGFVLTTFVGVQDKLSKGQFSNWLCYTATKACKGKTPPLPKDRKPGPEFVPMDPQEAQMEKMLAGMKVI